MTQESMNDQEVVSALADGQLRGDEFLRAVNLLESSAEHRATWHAYHAVGDMMRAGACSTIERDRAFLQRLRLNLAQEPASATSTVAVVSEGREMSQQAPSHAVLAGNDSSFRWAAWGGVASVVAVSFVAWQMFTGAEAPARDVAQTTESTVSTQTVAKNEFSEPSVADDQVVMIRDPRLDALLSAHQQLGGTSAFQNPTGFVRSATFTGADR